VLGLPAGPNDRCTPSEAQFIDESMPDYHVLAAGEQPSTTSSRTDTKPSPGPVISVVRFADNSHPISCEQVRTASYDGN
jgi:hypothetical protein